tara:strand:+ start:83 stop:760 length:678 start_codon:yes stop_codon:yes gene_type:complete
MTKVHLLGKAGNKFGKEFNFKAKNLKQVMRAIAVQRKGFYNFFFEEQEKGVEYAFKRGDEFINKNEAGLSLTKDDIFIVPVPQGSGLKDEVKKVLGQILMVVGFILLFTPLYPVGSALMGLGSYLYMDGIMGLAMDDTPPESEESKLFNGPIGTVKSGVAIPLIYGQLEVAGTPLNYGFTDKRVTSVNGWTNINRPGQTGSGDIGGGVGSGGTGDEDAGIVIELE